MAGRRALRPLRPAGVGHRWEDYYASYAGSPYFDWLRAQLTAPDVADIVLVDSRTGITEMGGVCTRQLADVVVSFCAPNLQNLYGVAQMAQSFLRDQLIAARGQPLDVVAVPTRLQNSEIDARNRFEERFKSLLDGHTPMAFRKAGAHTSGTCASRTSPSTAYEETLAVGQERVRAPRSSKPPIRTWPSSCSYWPRKTGSLAPSGTRRAGRWARHPETVPSCGTSRCRPTRTSSTGPRGWPASRRRFAPRGGRCPW